MLTVRAIPLVTSLFLGASALAFEEIPLTNWPVPLLWQPTAVAGDEPGFPVSPTSGRRGALAPSSVAHSRTEALALPSTPLTFVAITPCRLADTRVGTFPAGYGPPALSAGLTRDFVFTSRCGIPTSAQAVSTNLTVTNTLGPGFILNYPAGGSLPSPPVSSVNYSLGQTVANAAIISLGSGGAATIIAGVSGTDLIVDVNGYYAQPLGMFSRLLGAGYVDPLGNKTSRYVNLGTWTSLRIAVGNYGITFPGLRPGCEGPYPTVQVTLEESSFFYSLSIGTTCASGNVMVQVLSYSAINVRADSGLWFAAYAPAPAASPLIPQIRGWNPSTCTFTVSTGVETCE